jgi:hypothetical protein
VVKRFSTRRLSCAVVLTLTIALGAGALVFADDLVRLSRNVPGESKPIVIDADDITTWVEGPYRVVLLRGQVLVQHGILRARFSQGVLLIDLKRYQQTRVWDVELYAEGEVRVQSGAEVTSGPTAFVDLHTRGELRFNAHKNKVTQQAQPENPVYRRALVQKAALQPDVADRGRSGPVKPVSHKTEGPPPGPATPTQTTQPVTPPLPVPPPGPPAAAPPGTAPPPAPPPGSAAPAPPPPPPRPGNNPPRGPGPQARLPGPLGVPAPSGPSPARQYTVVPRNPAGFQSQVQTDARTGEKAVIATGGFLLTVRSVDEQGRTYDMLDIEADRLVLWTRGDPQQLFSTLRTAEGTQTNRELEFYLSGNVEIRSRSATQERTLRAQEVYYDVGNNVAVAVGADVELRQPGFPDPVHFRASEIEMLSPTQYRALQGEFFSSRLPSDPGLKVVFTHATLEERRLPRRGLFSGVVTDPRTGQPATVPESWVVAEDVFLRVEDVPVFYLPVVSGDARDPLGPVESIHLGANRIFGAQIGVGLDVYDLLGLDRIPGTRWRADVDYLSERGPALGTTYDFAGDDIFATRARYSGQIKLWGLHDTGTDILGGGRGEFEDHPDWRGRATARINVQELPAGFSVQGQISGLSDKNFLEQFYKREFDEDPNQDTFLYLKQQQDGWAWTLLVEPRLRQWVTETEWLPRADAYLLGQSFFDLLTYNVHGSAGYALLRPTEEPPFPFSSTDQRIDTGRFDLMQELALPFYAGPFKVVPYGLLDLTYYTRDLTGEDTGRAYGGGGVRASLPLTRLYPDVQSLLFNLNGINHKIVLSGNYTYVDTNVSHTSLPQLDRLNDDATDQSQRDIRPLQPFLNPGVGLLLATSPLYDPQFYAIRRLVDNRVDTLDGIQVLQLDLRQRWQTKRGFPAHQHIVDWMTLDLSASYFPHPSQDNFGNSWAFLEYDWLWNVGDRTALVSTGWYDPFDNGPRVFTIGAFLNRPDRTSFYLGYRVIEPVGSRALSGAVSYIFSPKYAMTVGTAYDFGTNQTLANSVVFTRMGTDLQVSLGFTYNTMQNNFGVSFEILPNLVQPGRRIPGVGIGSELVGR